MDEYTADAFVNRDDPIPVIVFDGQDGQDGQEDLSDYADNDTPSASKSEGSVKEGKRQRLRKHLSRHNIKEKVSRAHEAGSSMQDRMLEKLLQQVIPLEDQSKDHDHKRSTSPAPNFTERPSFNITTMSTNFRRFNSRVGVVFFFEGRMVRLFSWKTTSHTLSFLAVYSFVCLDPYILSVLPLATILLALLIPSFIARHPAAPTTLSSNSFQYSTTGPPIAPAPTVRPAKEFSKDFFRNMRDLQNSMEDFSRVHDKVVDLLAPPTNFSDEALSSTLFLILFILSCLMFIASSLLPWRLIFLVTGWIVTFLGHPRIQKNMLRAHRDYIEPHEKEAKSWLDAWVTHDIILDSAPETREVEIFELQKLAPSAEWEPWLFSSSPYDPMAASRIAGERPKGTRFFEDVQAPRGWEWDEKKWTLDLWSREWVEERIITGVEIETEGERWVYDLNYDNGDGGIGLHEYPTKVKAKKVGPSWEEGTDVGGSGTGNGQRGIWRRRRWTRIVRRKQIVAAVDS